MYIHIKIYIYAYANVYIHLHTGFVYVFMYVSTYIICVWDVPHYTYTYKHHIYMYVFTNIHTWCVYGTFHNIHLEHISFNCDITRVCRDCVSWLIYMWRDSMAHGMKVSVYRDLRVLSVWLKCVIDDSYVTWIVCTVTGCHDLFIWLIWHHDLFIWLIWHHSVAHGMKVSVCCDLCVLSLLIYMWHDSCVLWMSWLSHKWHETMAHEIKS